MNQKKIGEFIAKIRKEKKLTQEELATKIGVSNKTISRWENGVNMPDYSLLKPLSNELGITINELLSGTKIKKEKIIEEYENNLVNVLKEYKKMKKIKNIIFMITCILLYFVIMLILINVIPSFIMKNAKVLVNTDITKYNEFIGSSAEEKYKNKWGMDESIFPDSITNNMKVEDYKMVYYNPWDAQYLSYLIVEYNNEDYEKEINRLESYNSTEYIGYYNVTGFTNYKLVAITADKYQGFIYALTDNNNKIIYVELIFCNYFYDLNYKEYINNDYLPNGFDATKNNEYRKQLLKVDN